MMRHRCPVDLSCLDASFEPQWGRKDVLTACCLLAAGKKCCQPLDPKKWCKTSKG